MNGGIPSELYWLTLTALLTALLWVPYILKHIVEVGVVPALTYQNLDTTPEAAWGKRAKRAHYNAVENLAVFAPLAITVVLIDAGSGTTATACAVYFFARLVHYPMAVFRVPFLRTLTFAIGWLAVLVLVVAILGAI